MPDYLKEVKFEWLYAGRIMNCLVVIECSWVPSSTLLSPYVENHL